MKWYDYAWFPWTVTKFAWEKYKAATQKPQEPGRAPQTSCYGRPLPLVYGKTRLTGNVLYYANGWPSDVGVLAYCEGPIAGFGRGWRDKDLAPENPNPNRGPWESYVRLGSRPVGSTFNGSVDPDHTLGYPGIAYLGMITRWTGTTSLGSLSVELKAFLHATGGDEGDANPADILKGSPASPAWSMLCHPEFGARFPFEVVTDVGPDGNAASSYRRYVEQAGLWLSPAFTDQRPARSHLEDVLAATNSTCRWRANKLEIVPLGDRPLGTYAPYVVAEYEIGPGDYATTEDRIQIELPPETDTFNIAPVEFLDRNPAAAATDPAYAYNAAIIEDPEPVNVSLRGERRASTVTMHAICRRDVALQVSRFMAQRMSYARTQYRFNLPWRYCRLEVLDYLLLTDPLLGVDAIPVRIDEIDEDPETRTLTITATEWPYGIGETVKHVTSSSDAPAASLGPYLGEARFHEISVQNWIALPMPMTAGGNHRAWSALVWNGSVAAAFAPSACFTTSNFVSFTERTFPYAGVAYDCVWTGGMFVAVGSLQGGYNGALSYDAGASWTAITLPGVNDYRAVAYGSVGGFGTLCAVGLGGQCATSTNGTSWTARTIGTGTWRAIARSPSLGLFVAVGNNGGSAVCASSPDGQTWTPRTVPAGSMYSGVIWVEEWGLFVIGGPAGVAYSADGIAWVAGTGADGASIQRMAWTGFVLLATPDAEGTARALVTRDGRTWRLVSAGLPAPTTSALAWIGSRAVALSSTGSTTGVSAMISQQI